MGFQLFAAADQLAADEYLRYGSFASDGAYGSSGGVFAQYDFFVRQALVLQQLFGFRAERAQDDPGAVFPGRKPGTGFRKLRHRALI